ncbi:MAG: UDP-N-acetylmuramoyl-L-alanyl-D-glutamate--2,6-diaminopimelate ligase [Pseudomonadota bacterium]
MMAQQAMSGRPLLDQLFAGIGAAPPIAVTDVTLDSRRVTPGSLFLACQGHEHHGLEFLDQALAAGAVAIAYEPRDDLPVVTGKAVAVPVTDLRTQLGRLARRFFADPSAQLHTSAITGTNGKTTVTWLLAGAWHELGRPAGYIGTLGAGVDSAALSSTGLTTPDVVELSRTLAEFVHDGAEAAALEASSHALDQDRLAGLTIDAAVLTNLGRDHLDYHGSHAAYAAAKAKLFARRELAVRVVNGDDAFGATLAKRFAGSWQTSKDRTRAGDPRHVVAVDIDASVDGLALDINVAGERVTLQSPLFGSFNVDNLLSVLAVLAAAGIEPQQAARALGRVAPPPGRMQRIAGASDITVIVDFAHTADALTVALDALRAHCTGRLICVFGAGGDRDVGKRGPMGEAVAQRADRFIVTSDNPRSENPDAIIDDILRGVPTAVDAMREPDRRTAIERAIDLAQADDIVLIAGRGHETQQIVGDERIPFDDAVVAAAVLEARA